MIRTMFCEIRIVLLVLSISELLCVIDADPQLDLPPINSKKNALSAIVKGKPKVLPNSYAVKILGNEEDDDDDDDDKNDEHDGNGNDVEPNGRGVSSDYDRDRSLRYGPPYTDDTNRQFYRNNQNNNNNYNNYYGDNYYNRSSYDDYANRQRYSNHNGGDGDRYYANRNRNNGEDDRYYAQRGRDGYNNNPDNYYNNGGVGGGGDVAGGDDKFYADRNLPRDPPFYRNENDRNRYGNGYPYTNNPNGDGRPYYQNDNNFDRAPPGGQFPDGNPFEQDEQARIEQERRYRIEEANLRRILADVDEQSAIECSLNVGAQWNFETNVNDVAQQQAVSEAIKSKEQCMNHQRWSDRRTT